MAGHPSSLDGGDQEVKGTFADEDAEGAENAEAQRTRPDCADDRNDGSGCGDDGARGSVSAADGIRRPIDRDSRAARALVIDCRWPQRLDEAVEQMQIESANRGRRDAQHFAARRSVLMSSAQDFQNSNRFLLYARGVDC
jgi:hypothetical protein